MSSLLTEMAKNVLPDGGQCWHDAQLRERAHGGNGSPSRPGEIVAIGAGHAFDQAQQAQAVELAREGRSTQARHEGLQTGISEWLSEEGLG